MYYVLEELLIVELDSCLFALQNGSYFIERIFSEYYRMFLLDRGNDASIGILLPAKRYFSLIDEKTFLLELYEISFILLLLNKDKIKDIDTKPYGTTFVAKNMKEIYKHNLDYAIHQNFRFNQLLELSGAIESDKIILEKYDVLVLQKRFEPMENELTPLLKKWQ